MNTVLFTDEGEGFRVAFVDWDAPRKTAFGVRPERSTNGGQWTVAGDGRSRLLLPISPKIREFAIVFREVRRSRQGTTFGAWCVLYFTSSTIDRSRLTIGSGSVRLEDDGDMLDAISKIGDEGLVALLSEDGRAITREARSLVHIATLRNSKQNGDLVQAIYRSLKHVQTGVDLDSPANRSPGAPSDWRITVQRRHVATAVELLKAAPELQNQPDFFFVDVPVVNQQ